MPKKAKDNLIEENKIVEKAVKNTKKNAAVKVSDTTKNAKATTVASKSVSKKVTDKNLSAKKSASKKSASNKVSTKNSTAKAPSKKSRSTTAVSRKKKAIEYYDLPTAYNKTIVKILAQTPSILFVYWELSLEHCKDLTTKYGEDFFYNTTPFLLVHNITKNYSFEVEINDYANSWYIHIPDSDCKYDVSLIRKPKNDKINLENGYVPITSSNDLDAPNDHILFEKLGKTVFFRNIETNFVEEKDISSFSFMYNIGRVYNIYDLYKEIYKNEFEEDNLGFGLYSSQFK